MSVSRLSYVLHKLLSGGKRPRLGPGTTFATLSIVLFPQVGVGSSPLQLQRFRPRFIGPVPFRVVRLPLLVCVIRSPVVASLNGIVFFWTRTMLIRYDETGCRNESRVLNP